MKKELPIAACLLALGVALCWNVNSPARGQVSPEKALLPASEVLAEGTPDVTALPAAAFVKILQEAGGKQDVWCKSTLDSIGRELNQLPSLAVRTQLECRVHDTSLMAHGKYFQAENGRKSRLELVFDGSQPAHSVLQVCDGLYVQTLRSSAKQQRLEFVDLSRLVNKDARLSVATLPASWVMGGGLGAALTHYAEAFHFQAIDTSDPNRLYMRGIWDARVLATLIHSDVNVQERPAEVQWDKLPAHVPHGVELTFAKPGGQAMQPERITFFRFSQQQGRAVAKPMMTIEFEKLAISQTLPPELFTIESSGFEAVELTDVYNQKILKLTAGLPKVAVEPRDAGQHVR